MLRITWNCWICFTLSKTDGSFFGLFFTWRTSFWQHWLRRRCWLSRWHEQAFFGHLCLKITNFGRHHFNAECSLANTHCWPVRQHATSVWRDGRMLDNSPLQNTCITAPHSQQLVVLAENNWRHVTAVSTIDVKGTLWHVRNWKTSVLRKRIELLTFGTDAGKLNICRLPFEFPATRICESSLLVADTMS